MATLYEADGDAAVGPDVEARIAELERQMPQLYTRHADVFALANAWAERHDAILARVPAAQREQVEARLARIGIRWGVVPGARVTVELRTADIAALARARLRRRA